ncbi:hypothetical protein BCR44DRAFT_364363 [Catenaria anguillulae PL171]|uniref:Uncharacterized protein n=1 Tax=Catenaria anguillulae PL171 TaxID=765915 RepID=A0A1Y2H7Y4_9FUNG|nr:hypothetical protein BCR44DRAFT_364363 [Catenaria anguillulae PL171]
MFSVSSCASFLPFFILLVTRNLWCAVRLHFFLSYFLRFCNTHLLPARQLNALLCSLCKLCLDLLPTTLNIS